MRILLLVTICLFAFASEAQQVRIARLKYDGGGDWYANKTALPNLITFCNRQLKSNIYRNEDVVESGSPDIFLYPYVYMTGHGNVIFSADQAENMRNYLTSGGFLHIDDNYGMDPFIRLELQKIFPDKSLVEIPFNHPLYHQKYDFDEGVPKIHEHDGKPAQGFGIIHEGRIVVFYSYESDLGNGWEDQSVYNDPEKLRQEALKMGANLLAYVFSEGS
ncbi:MAG: DUF4159 domain-containing protein [Cyclobacteriaceae bacterium]